MLMIVTLYPVHVFIRIWLVFVSFYFIYNGYIPCLQYELKKHGNSLFSYTGTLRIFATEQLSAELSLHIVELS